MFALIQEARSIGNEQAVRISERLNDIGANLVAQCIFVPSAAAQK
jgi:hypothetical protein